MVDNDDLVAFANLAPTESLGYGVLSGCGNVYGPGGRVYEPWLPGYWVGGGLYSLYLDCCVSHPDYMVWATIYVRPDLEGPSDRIKKIREKLEKGEELTSSEKKALEKEEQRQKPMREEREQVEKENQKIDPTAKVNPETGEVTHDPTPKPDHEEGWKLLEEGIKADPTIRVKIGSKNVTEKLPNGNGNIDVKVTGKPVRTKKLEVKEAYPGGMRVEGFVPGNVDPALVLAHELSHAAQFVGGMTMEVRVFVPRRLGELLPAGG
ncbi:MAG: hypothetical protein AB7O52_02645 [Planctomycetota bacterium]